MHVVQVLGALVIVFAVAASGAAREPGARLFRQWRSADADADGRLCRTEAQSIPRLAKRFDALDADHDGFLAPEEVRASRSQSRRSRVASSGADTLVATADRNRDGRLARDEVDALLPRLAPRFDEIDADRDGALNRTELETWLAARRALRSSAK